MKRINAPKKNAPIASLIKQFSDAKSGKVAESRKEIKRRFDYLDWKYQKRIIMVCLYSCKSDREWIYTKLLNCWDDFFRERIDQLWKCYREPRCAWIIISHFPEEYIESHIDELGDGRNYYFVCRRLAHNPSFVINRQRLSAIDYLSVLVHCNRPISTQEAIDILFEITSEACSENELINRMNRIYNTKRGKVLCPYHFTDISKALYILQNKGIDEVADQYYEWCEEISNRIKHSTEFRNLNAEALSDEAYNHKRLAISTLYIDAALHNKSKIKHPIAPTENQIDALEQMLHSPQLKLLIEKLNLTL